MTNDNKNLIKTVKTAVLSFETQTKSEYTFGHQNVFYCQILNLKFLQFLVGVIYILGKIYLMLGYE